MSREKPRSVNEVKSLILVGAFVLISIFASLFLSFYMYRNQERNLKTKYINDILYNKITGIDYILDNLNANYDEIYNDYQNYTNASLDIITRDVRGVAGIYVHDFEDGQTDYLPASINFDGLGEQIGPPYRLRDIYIYRHEQERGNNKFYIVISKPIENGSKLLIVVFHLPYEIILSTQINQYRDNENINTFIVYNDNRITKFNNTFNNFDVVTNTYFKTRYNKYSDFYSLKSSNYNYAYDQASSTAVCVVLLSLDQVNRTV